ncbi:Uma2 family endonuclease [Nonomuraea jiangxiensis]|uniref:Putative restriction endonuclease n=1 Tax=Nonomuraea jiangxiensis TaxID=633440 RepID=A0A1G9M5E2_9ACTN|nr:Uma2 family endonuclease [Nonomuraea jiangxiensis]SDL69363.1 Putative restriction endonuclease [Nonomuraea jiangxiensis]
MTAEAVVPTMTTPSLPDWVFPPPGGFVAEDLDHIPDLPAHTELIDGSLVFVRPQASFHMKVVDLLVAHLRQAAPDDLRVRREMSVILDPSQRPEPDLAVIRAAAVRDDDETFYKAEDVLLVIEVVSPESKLRDRGRKPQLYADAGIPHFWLVEKESGKPAVYVYKLDPVTRSYAHTGVHFE